MNPHLTRLALAGAAVALAVPATAQAAKPPIDIPVPAGKIEHNITEETFTANYTITDMVPRRERIEEWLSDDFGHVVITNLITGKIRSECIQGWGTVTCVNKDGRTSLPAPEDGDLVYNTQAEKYAWFRRSVDSGWYNRQADSTFQGKPVQVWTVDSSAPRDPADSYSEVLIDGDAKLQLRWTTGATQNGQTHEQVQTLLKHEVYSQSSHRGRSARAAARRRLKRARKVKRAPRLRPAPAVRPGGSGR